MNDVVSTGRAGVVAVMLAGGQGARLHELTRTTCKPAVPFAGGRRIVDWTMDNLSRTAADAVIVATQYRPDGLVAHLSYRWAGAFAPGVLSLCDGARSTDRLAGYRGTADAVRCNLSDIEARHPDVVLVVAADHIYRMDYDAMIAAHRASGAPVTVAATHVPVGRAHGFGILSTAGDGRATSFTEKPSRPETLSPGAPELLASMGVYAFDADWLVARLRRADAGRVADDFGTDILPGAVASGEVRVHVPGVPAGAAAFYWRDVGTLDALRESCIEVAQGVPGCPCPALSVGGGGLSPTGILPSGTVVLPGGHVSPGARLIRTLVAPGAVVPRDLRTGQDPVEDARWFRRTPQGTVLITKEMLARRAAQEMRSMMTVPPATRPAGARIRTRLGGVA